MIDSNMNAGIWNSTSGGGDVVDMSYGVEWDITNATTVMTRVGNLDMHRELPIQKLMRRCLLLDNGTVNYYLLPTDSTKKMDGSPANLTGTDGQVMVEIPEHYILFAESGNLRKVTMSLTAKASYTKVTKSYISAYEASLQRSTGKLSSVQNVTTDYRGGNNNATFDGQPNSLLGMPVTFSNRTAFRTNARNRGSINWNLFLHSIRETVFWLYMVEYANMNSQLNFNPVATIEGYKQGGLGKGVTDVNVGNWSTFNGYYPFVPCGVSNYLGNSTGVAEYAPLGWPVAAKFEVATYRGIENVFGHIHKWTDGINVNVQSIDAGGLSEVYVADGLEMSDVNNIGYTKVGNTSIDSGYIKNLLFTTKGNIMPSVVANGASATTHWCDYLYASTPSTQVILKGVFSGGSSNNGSFAGLGFSSTSYVPASASTDLGTRLCFKP